MLLKKIISIILPALLIGSKGFCQLVIVAENNAQALAQRLVGDGVSISNVTLNHATIATGFFFNQGGTNIGIDSGIVLTSGRAKSDFRPPIQYGLDGNGTFTAGSRLADHSLGFTGDPDLSALVGGKTTFDAIILEFDFVPLGDSVKFRYLLSSEEYPEYPCSAPPNDFYDVFGFFISGPGYPVKKNIALVPGTNTEVSIHTISDQPCSPYPQYYVDNLGNRQFIHDGHTVVLTAEAAVTPCATYHLKIAIADVSDANWDSGVFLEARSLTSNIVKIKNLTQTDGSGNSYLVEGCATGSFKVKRPRTEATPLAVTLSYGGTSTNGVDVLPLPNIVVIPANDSEVTVNVMPIIDNIPEGIEEIKIYAEAGCASGSGIPTDSAIIQIRDYDILGITPDSAGLCRGASRQLIASPGYSFYQWDVNPTLSNTSIRTPIATPVVSQTTYICTATEGTCNAKDSAVIRIKEIDFVAKTEINCANASTGEIKTAAGWEWQYPVQFSINNGAWQADSTFSNLPVGIYKIKMRDGTGCTDSITVTLTQLYPDLQISNIATTAAGCSGLDDGTITIFSNGGLLPYSYSINGTPVQSSSTFNALAGTYQMTVLDANGCAAMQNAVVPFSDTVVVDAGNGGTICEGKTIALSATSNGQLLSWSPANSLSNPSALNPVAKPSITTKYFLTASSGICVHTDSVTVFVNPAPIPNAGPDKTICYNSSTILEGSGGFIYSWRPANYLNSTTIGQPQTSPPATFRYYLWVIDALGCQSLFADTVKVKVVPQVRIFAGNDTTVAINQPLQLKAIELSNSNVTSYTWSPAYGLNNPFIANPVAILDRDILYYVTGTTPEGCNGYDAVRVRVIKGPDIYVPTAFTPNSDGLNDVLRPIPVGIKEFRYFRVYNRWGQLVFSSNNPLSGWDGKIKGVLQSNATFVWLAEAVDYKGNVFQRRGSSIILSK